MALNLRSTVWYELKLQWRKATYINDPKRIWIATFNVMFTFNSKLTQSNTLVINNKRRNFFKVSKKISWFFFPENDMETSEKYEKNYQNESMKEI